MENIVTSAIAEDYHRKIQESVTAHVAIAGGGPSGLVAAAELASRGLSVNLYEKNLTPGGGMWGGAMLFNSILIEEEFAETAEELGMKLRKYRDSVLLADSVQATAALISRACSAGVRMFNGMAVEDVTVDRYDRVNGVVVNWAPVMKLGMMVDPLMTCAGAVLDATGHPAEIVTRFAAKNNTEITVPGEASLNVEMGEKHTVEHTGMVHPGLFVSGMSACATAGGYRMGPVFGGMLKSGLKAAEEITEYLNKSQ
ncbi:ribose 1,5-bisphosphate isomerase [Candidatus Fermentibacteria bacterium]|nr:MAG: ribose 1,5-bisphosphate isomerase [Candidatus Fermentibacteria bacterium]